MPSWGEYEEIWEQRGRSDPQNLIEVWSLGSLHRERDIWIETYRNEMFTQVVKAGKDVLGDKNTYRTIFAVINSHKLGSLNNTNLLNIP